MARLSKFSFSMLLFLCISNVWGTPAFDEVTITLKQQDYILQIADSPALRQHGLMYRKALGSGQGMLFAYKKPGNYRIWMKNTLIPLTVLWVDSDARIIHKALLQPCMVDPCPIESASRPSRYIIELSEDNFHRFQLGDRLKSLLKWSLAQ